MQYANACIDINNINGNGGCVWWETNDHLFRQVSIPPSIRYFIHPFLQIILALNILCGMELNQFRPHNQQRRPLPFHSFWLLFYAQCTQSCLYVIRMCVEPRYTKLLIFALSGPINCMADILQASPHLKYGAFFTTLIQLCDCARL